jgi:hypothetical protein
MKTLALVAALAFGTLFIPQSASAGCSGLSCAVEHPDAPYAEFRIAEARASAAHRRRHGTIGLDATYRRLRHHWGA